MKSLFLIYLITFIQILNAQSIEVTLKFPTQMEGYFLIKNASMEVPDTLCMQTFKAEGISNRVYLPKDVHSGKVVPLFFELSLRELRSFSGLMISDDIELEIQKTETGVSLKQHGSEKNAWYYALVDTLEHLVSQKPDNPSAQADALGLLINVSDSLNSEVACLLLTQLLAMDAIRQEDFSITQNFIQNAGNSFWASKANSLLSSKMGQKKQSIEGLFLFHESGERLNLSDALKKKYLLLDFWASWCGPCIAAIPHVKSLYQDHSDKIDIINVSIDKNLSQWEKAKKNINTPWLSLIDNASIEDKLEYKLSITSIPQYMLFNKGGQLLYRGSDLDALRLVISQD